MTPNIYLNFPGTTEAAMDFYADLFGSEVTHLQRMSEVPGMEPAPGTENLIMHCRLKAGNITIMASDHVEAYAGPFQGQHGFSVQLGLDTPEEAARVFARLSDGGEVTMPLEKTFWARAFGMCRDRFGTPWMVNCD